MVTEIALHGQFASLYKRKKAAEHKKSSFHSIVTAFFSPTHKKNTTSLLLKYNKFSGMAEKRGKLKQKEKSSAKHCFSF